MTVIYLWRIKRRFIGHALVHMALDRFLLSRISGVSFYKSVGTGTGEKFTPSDADPEVWGLIAVTSDLSQLESSRLIRSWQKISTSQMKLLLEPISSHGSWAGKEPFVVKAETKTDGRIVAITRARIKWNLNFLFWRSVPPVTQSLRSQPGLIKAIGIGEAPIGLQGTLSIWEDGASLRAFAYKGATHAAVIDATKKHQWYSEELFARFSLLEMSGTIEKADTAE